MAEYIEREAVYNTLKAKYCDECTDEKCQMCEYADIMFVLDNLPIADVQPVRRGHWIKERIDDEKSLLCGAIKNIKCSVCNKGGLSISYFCPYCGADMREPTEG